MYCLLLAAVSFLNLSTAITGEPSQHHIETQNYNLNGYVVAQRPQNITFVDKDENMLKVPVLSKFIEEHKSKKKIKKTPKRTIQKIIKKNKGKLRKMYFNQVTTRSTIPPEVVYDRLYDKDESIKKSKAETTTQTQHIHRSRNKKVIRYHMPFQKLQKKKEDIRHKRGLSRELFILKDLDQVQFLSKEKDNDVVIAHITKYWKV